MPLSLENTASKTAWTKKVWIYDFHTNVHKTLKQNRLSVDDFKEFIDCYKPQDRSKRRGSKKRDRWKSSTYEELIARDKTNLDIFWLKDDKFIGNEFGRLRTSDRMKYREVFQQSLEDTDNLPPPDVLAAEIVEQLEAALEEFRSVESALANNGE